jgi:diaminopimelate decarboxylase
MEEIELAVKEGVQINIDNTSILEQFGAKYGSSVPVCVRINPHVMAGGNLNISTGHIDSKFGISIYQMRHVERIVNSTGLVVNGLHMHTGSDILDVEVFFEVQKFCLSKHSFSKTSNLSILALDSKFLTSPMTMLLTSKN